MKKLMKIFSKLKSDSPIEVLNKFGTSEKQRVNAIRTILGDLPVVTMPQILEKHKGEEDFNADDLCSFSYSETQDDLMRLSRSEYKFKLENDSIYCEIAMPFTHNFFYYYKNSEDSYTLYSKYISL